ncbi:proton pump-interactor 1 [Physcomitrium patens]|uniref:Uncharacterized protein n=2 Tax=Physcomitrium patens TaxID=3218 RepID=A9TG04_PHYPA|nr:proton pump-interactor 1-like [Physcomitrium patens]XP_024392543.1 proton pump-interactor 1-like [Physcomitrium patens]PNR42801.1 hypothetical protein PHYPA_017632 [Physcomitrium patens]|eukprot:XP_024392542.1 proton pump-interactor 1-like [Physcomitrella patens]
MVSTIETAHEAMKEQDGEFNVMTAGADTDKQSTDDAVPVFPEDLVSETNVKIDGEAGNSASAPEADNEVPDVKKAEAVGSTDWNNAPVAGWASAEVDAPAVESGVLGSAPVENPPLQVYNFYMVRVPRPTDKQGKVEISSAEQQLQDKTDLRNAHNNTVQAARVRRNEAFEKLKAARQVERDWLTQVRAKQEEMKPLRDSLRKLKEAGREVREKSRDMPTSEEELDHRIASLEWRIQHESIPLKEEKQLMREIKALQASRETVRANAPLFAQVHDALGQRDELEAALKPLDAEYKKLDLELNAAKKVREQAEKEYDQMNSALSAVQDKLQSANDKRQEAYVHKKSLKEQEYLRMKDFYDNKRDIQEAKMLANKPNNRKEVEEYCNAQLERMLELWNTDEEWRKNYVKDNEWSTVRRFGTFDGRGLAPDEARPILPGNGFVPFAAGPASSQQNGGRSVGNQREAVPAKAEEVVAKGGKEKISSDPTIAVEKSVSKQDREAVKEPEASTPVLMEPVKSKEELEREALELKEQRRAVEMAKAKEAEERKKRLAEKAQAKALARAQKEAEKKEKEKEKKALKKAAAVTPLESESAAEKAPTAESNGNGSSAEVEEQVAKEVKVSSSQRKRGMTNASKAAAKIARAKAPMPSVRAKQQKVLGMPVQWAVGAAVGAVLLAVLVYFLLSRSSASGSGGFEDGARSNARPGASSESF